VWRLANLSARREVSENLSFILGIPLSPDGSALGVNTTSGLWLFRLGDSVEGIRLAKKGKYLAAVFSADGKTFLAPEQQAGCVSVWDVATGRLIREIAMLSAPQSLAFAPDCRPLVAVNPSNTLSLLRLEEP